jgi:hypothetical protein
MSKFDQASWERSFWEAVAAGHAIDFADVEWYGLDRDNSIALFTSAGPGPVPRSAFRDRNQHDAVAEFFRSLPRKGHAEMLVKHGWNMDDWSRAAERGLYAFDYEKSQGRVDGYYLIARPEKAIGIEELPAWVQQWLEGIRLNDAVFAELVHSPVNPLGGGLDCL